MMIAQEDKTRYIAEAVHDMYSPLTTLKLRLELLRQTPQHLQDHVSILEHQVQRLESLINDVVLITRLDSGILTTELTLLDMNRIVERVAAALEPAARRKHLDLMIDLEPALGPVLADERQVERVLVNLAQNAINYTQEYGMVFLGTTQFGDDVMLLVQDNGIGIAADALPRIFDRFYRAENARRAAEGTGLGLAIVREIVERFGGEISVESQPYKGSRFTVRLPVWKRMLQD